MTSRTRLGLWAIEFLSITAIGILPTSGVSLWWLALAVIVLLAAKSGEYQVNARERWAALRQEFRLLLELLPSDRADVRCTYHVPVRAPLKGYIILRQDFA